MKKFLLLAALLPALAFGHGAPVIWNGTSAKWLPSGLNSAGVCKLSAAGVMSSSTVSDSELATSYVKADGTRALTGNWNVGAFNITANSFIGSLTGNASTASALASNPSDCAAGTKATAIDASGNLTCSAASLTADVSGILPLANGGTNKNMTAVAGGLVYTDADSQEVGSVGTSGQAAISGGTGAPTWYAPTVGSVLFAGTSGILQQDNSNFFWDDTNNWLGIGTASPAYKLHVKTAGNNETAMRLQPSAGSSNDIDFRFEGTNSPTFRIDRGASSLLVFSSGNMNLNATATPVWNVQHNAAATQTTLANYFTRDQGYPVLAVKNTSSTANNASGIVFPGNSNASTEATSGILGVHESHTGSAETGHLEFWTRNAGTVAKRLNIAKDGVHTMSAYGAGVAQFDSSGVISSTAPGTSGNVLTSNGSAWVSSAPAASSSTLSVATKTSNYTMTNSDDVILCNTTTSMNVTMHSALSATTKSYKVKNIGTADCTILTNQNFDRATGYTSISIPAGGLPTSGVELIPDSGGSSWLIF